MTLVRFLAYPPADLLELHLKRLGAAPDALGAAAGQGRDLLALVTAAPVEAIDAFAGLAPTLRVVRGDPERARGAALLLGSRAAMVEAADRFADDARASPLACALRDSLARAEGAPATVAIGKRTFEWGRRSYVMGIVNVTPDSFSDGGRYYGRDSAIAAGERLAAEGADFIDVGGESTRPNALPVSAQDEIDRVVPVIEALARHTDAPISIDTTKAEVADAALRAGAALVNDISGFKFDAGMAPVIARHGAAACAMHIQGEPRTMQSNPSYFDVVGEVMEGLQASLAHAVRCGVPAERVLLDPGIGFGKTAGHNLFLLRHLRQLRSLGQPLLVGASRKSFIGKVTGRAVGDRLAGSLAVLTAAIMEGAHVVRVHDVAESVVAARMIDAVRQAREGGFAFVA